MRDKEIRTTDVETGNHLRKRINIQDSKGTREMPNKRGKVKVREKTLKRLRKGMSDKEDREVRFIRETCRWDKGDM